MKFRLHVPSLPHTELTGDYSCCAFTANVMKFSKMMVQRGHTVFLYGSEKNEAPCTEHVVIGTDAQRQRWFGTINHADFYQATWDSNSRPWRELNLGAAHEISKREQPGDILCLISGSQKPIADLFPSMVACEYAVGYAGPAVKHRCFPSHAHRHYVHGLSNEGDGRDLDTVIPHFFDPDELPFCADKEDWCLFIGRLIKRKGVRIAVDATAKAGVQLKVAGQGVKSYTPGKIVAPEVALEGPHIEYVGVADTKKRAELMGRARAVLVPTIYLEPFGNVVVEAMLCGTPVITSDYGAFPETVLHGSTGFRCNSVDEYAQAIHDAKNIRPERCREWAEQYTLTEIAPKYEAWFARLLGMPITSSPPVSPPAELLQRTAEMFAGRRSIGRSDQKIPD